MNIQPIGVNNNFYNVNNIRNNATAPSFQHLRIISKEHWDKDILDAVRKNKEIKKFENYLEKKHSVLELTIMEDFIPNKVANETLFSIMGTFARKFKIMGVNQEITPMANKKQTLSNLRQFKCDELIKTFEREEAKYNKQYKLLHSEHQMRDVMFRIRDEQKSLLDSILDFFF